MYWTLGASYLRSRVMNTCLSMVGSMGSHIAQAGFKFCYVAQDDFELRISYTTSGFRDSTVV